MNTIALIVAAGRGVRFGGDVPKQFRPLGERPLLSWTISRFEEAASIDEIGVVVAEEFLLYTREKVVAPFGFKKLNRIIAGGETRQESVLKGLKSLPYATSFVAIHDGARPLVAPEDIDKVVGLAQKDRAAIMIRPVAETIKRVEGEFILSTLDRSKLYLAETPQVFQYDIILSAHEKADLEVAAPDDAYLVEKLGFKVKTIIGRGPNPKVTTEGDLEYVKFIMGKNK